MSGFKTWERPRWGPIKPEEKEAFDRLGFFAEYGYYNPENTFLESVRTVVSFMRQLTVGVRQHTNFDKSIVYFVLLNETPVSGAMSTLKEARARARDLFKVLGVAQWEDLSETMD